MLCILNAKKSFHSLAKVVQMFVISPVAILNMATLSCQHNALMVLAGREYLRIVKRDTSSNCSKIKFS